MRHGLRCATLIRSPTEVVCVGAGSDESRGRQAVISRAARAPTQNFLNRASLLRYAEIDGKWTIAMQLDHRLGLGSPVVGMAGRRVDVVARTVGLDLAPVSDVAGCEQESSRKHGQILCARMPVYRKTIAGGKF